MFLSRWQNDHPKDPIDLYCHKSGACYQEYNPFPVSPDTPLSLKDSLSSLYSVAEDSQLLSWFMQLPVQDSLPFVIDYKIIVDAQDRDTELQELRQKHPQKYVQHTLAPDTQVDCFS